MLRLFKLISGSDANATVFSPISAGRLSYVGLNAGGARRIWLATLSIVSLDSSALSGMFFSSCWSDSSGRSASLCIASIPVARFVGSVLY